MLGAQGLTHAALPYREMLCGPGWAPDNMDGEAWWAVAGDEHGETIPSVDYSLSFVYV